jgi:hypothetical protein
MATYEDGTLTPRRKLNLRGVISGINIACTTNEARQVIASIADGIYWPRMAWDALDTINLGTECLTTLIEMAVLIHFRGGATSPYGQQLMSRLITQLRQHHNVRLN